MLWNLYYDNYNINKAGTFRLVSDLLYLLMSTFPSRSVAGLSFVVILYFRPSIVSGVSFSSFET